MQCFCCKAIARSAKGATPATMCSMATAGGAWRARGPVNCVKNCVKRGKTVQRSAGTFDTPEEAALQVAAYEAKLAEGIDPWNGEEVRSQHGRGQVRSQSPYAQCASAHKGLTVAGTTTKAEDQAAQG